MPTREDFPASHKGQNPTIILPVLSLHWQQMRGFKQHAAPLRECHGFHWRDKDHHQKQLGRKEFVYLTHPSSSSSPRGAKAGAQAGQGPGGGAETEAIQEYLSLPTPTKQNSTQGKVPSVPF